jgi:hypothetical protein
MSLTLLNFYPGKKGTAWKLAYRASENNFTGDSFRKTCSGLGETFTIIKSTNGNIFGGYTPKNWGVNSAYEYDSTSFLFLLYSKASTFSGPVKILHNTGGNFSSIYN